MSDIEREMLERLNRARGITRQVRNALLSGSPAVDLELYSRRRR